MGMHMLAGFYVAGRASDRLGIFDNRIPRMDRPNRNLVAGVDLRRRANAARKSLAGRNRQRCHDHIVLRRQKD
ncbi:hypothetical protein D3C86_2121640 [compost metagenome]